MAGDKHLTQDELIKAIIDIKDLDDRALAHLEECYGCKTEKDRFSMELDALSKKALALSFPPQPNIESILAFKKRKNASHIPFFKPAAAFSLIVVILICWLFIGEYSPTFNRADSDKSYLAQIEKDLELMSHIEAFESPALSGPTSQDDEATPFDEEFINFLIPIIEDKNGA